MCIRDRLTNVVSRRIAPEELGNMMVALTQLQNFIKSHNAQPIGPLVQAIKSIGPTLTSVFGALEPLTAVVIGVAVFGEPFTVQGAAGILLIVAAVTIVILHSGRRKA